MLKKAIILYRIAKNLLRRQHGEGLVQPINSTILWDRKGKPTDGGYTQVVWGAYFNTCRWRGRGGCPVHGRNQLNWVT